MVMLAVRGSRPMIAWLQTDLPEPDLAHQRHGAAGRDGERHLVDGAQHAFVDSEFDGQVLDAQQILHTVSS